MMPGTSPSSRPSHAKATLSSASTTRAHRLRAVAPGAERSTTNRNPQFRAAVPGHHGLRAGHLMSIRPASACGATAAAALPPSTKCSVTQARSGRRRLFPVPKRSFTTPSTRNATWACLPPTAGLPHGSHQLRRRPPGHLLIIHGSATTTSTSKAQKCSSTAHLSRQAIRLHGLSNRTHALSEGPAHHPRRRSPIPLSRGTHPARPQIIPSEQKTAQNQHLKNQHPKTNTQKPTPKRRRPGSPHSKKLDPLPPELQDKSIRAHPKVLFFSFWKTAASTRPRHFPEQ